MMSSAIFLSYASQDADAARRICDALRAAGLEVWFDLSELRGGDAWDASIRKQIKECALFVPIISTNTNARAEGYFRLEWKLAVDRSHLMADDQTFFVPVILADTPETTARVPDAFRARQWSRLTDDNAIAAFAQRVAKLLTGSASSGINAPSAAPALAPGEHLQTVSPAPDSNARGPAPVGAQVQPSSQGHANLDPDLHRDDDVKGVPTTTASRRAVSRTKVAAGPAITALTGISRREVLGEVSAMKLLAELQRRNVIRMAGLYLVGAWLVTQVAATLLPVLGAPDWVVKVLVALLALGFPAALVFSWVFELTPDGLKRDGDVEVTQSIAPQTARRMDRMLLVVAALAVGYFAVDKFVLAPSRLSDNAMQLVTPALPHTVATTPAAQPARAPIESKSIAVLAFADLSQSKDQEYFSDGVAEEILNALAKVEDLKVAGRTASFYFKGRNENLATIGSTLGVAHVLEGSVRKQGKRLRISAKLLRISDGVEMWADTFDGTDADIFALQENVAQQVTIQLKVALNAGAQGPLVDAGTRDPDAYSLYLRASDVFNRRDGRRYEEAVALLRQALQHDPAFARAHSRLAALYFARTSASSPDRYASLIAEAVAQAEQALRLNPGLAEPHAVLGVVHQNARRYGEARAAFARALQLDPTDVTANFWAALLDCTTGYIARCEAGLERTLALDPLLPQALNWRARLWLSAGDLEQAQRMIDRAREVGLSPAAASLTLPEIARARGDRVQARIQGLEHYFFFSVGLAPATTVFADAWGGDADAVARSIRLIDDYLADAPDPINPLVPITLVRIGEVERGLAVFADHQTNNDALFSGLFFGTRLYPQVWASPAFPRFLRKTGIAAYWDEFGPPPNCAKNASGDYRCE